MGTDQLINSVCEPCRSGAEPLAGEELERLRSQLPEWQIVEQAGVRRLHREFRFRNFVAALAFTNRVGELAETAGHHPALLTEWGRVTVQWWTHKIGGLHRNDFIMAARTDALVAGTAGEAELL